MWTLALFLVAFILPAVAFVPLMAHAPNRVAKPTDRQLGNKRGAVRPRRAVQPRYSEPLSMSMNAWDVADVCNKCGVTPSQTSSGVSSFVTATADAGDGSDKEKKREKCCDCCVDCSSCGCCEGGCKC